MRAFLHRFLTTEFGRHLIRPCLVWSVVPLPLALVGFGLAALLGGGEVRRLERACAADIASRIGGSKKQVSLTTKPNGLFGYLRGDLASATFRASEFETDGLPLLT